MRKGRFGVVLCLYPIVGFACVIFNFPLGCALVFVLALLAERDEWAGRQTLQALGLGLVSWFLQKALHAVSGHLGLSYGILGTLGAGAAVASALVYVAALVASVLAILRVSNDREADLPGLSSLAWRAYGKRRPAPMPGQYPPPYQAGFHPGAYPPPAQPGQPPYNGPAQAPQNGAPAPAPQNQNGQPQPPQPPHQPGGPQMG